MAKQVNTFRAKDRETWRAWLEKNHDSQKDVWLVFSKKHTGERCISYEESVEEALCFGWIDSIIKRLDDASYARKFTPRTDSENWSELNKKRLEKCIREGRMTDVGLAKVSSAASKRPARTASSLRKEVQVPPFMTKALKENSQAWANFSKLAPSHQRNYTLWIVTAKREETRERRLQEAIKLLAHDQKLGLK